MKITIDIDDGMYNDIINGREYSTKGLQYLPAVLYNTVRHSAQRSAWVPVSDPDADIPKDRIVWVTMEYPESGYRCVDTLYWDMTEWSGPVGNVIAWAPYEEPEPAWAENEEPEPCAPLETDTGLESDGEER